MKSYLEKLENINNGGNIHNHVMGDYIHKFTKTDIQFITVIIQPKF